jgi:hypothetical protein
VTHKQLLRAAAREKILRGATASGTGDYGFDAETGLYVDLVEAGIVDPANSGPTGTGRRRVGRERPVAHRGDLDRGPRAEVQTVANGGNVRRLHG